MSDPIDSNWAPVEFSPINRESLHYAPYIDSFNHLLDSPETTICVNAKQIVFLLFD